MQVQVQPFILFKPNKEQNWKLEEVNVTEQATFALKDQVLYATLKNGGLVAVDMTNGTKNGRIRLQKEMLISRLLIKMAMSILLKKDRRLFMQ